MGPVVRWKDKLTDGHSQKNGQTSWPDLDWGTRCTIQKTQDNFLNFTERAKLLAGTSMMGSPSLQPHL